MRARRTFMTRAVHSSNVPSGGVCAGITDLIATLGCRPQHSAVPRGRWQR